MMKELVPEIYANLAAEMGFFGLSKQDVAARADMRYQTFLDKYYGKSDWTVIESRRIIETCFPDKIIDWLFQRFR